MRLRVDAGRRAGDHRRAQGDEPSQSDVDDFLAKHGGFFPGAETLDDVIEQLADRMAAMQSLMRSLSPEQRAELQDTLDALLRDDRLRWDLAQLAANLDQVLPGGLGERVRFTGDQPLGLEAALDQLGRLQALDQLEAQLDGAFLDHDGGVRWLRQRLGLEPPPAAPAPAAGG